MFDPTTIVLIGLVFSAAAVIHGLCGFGFSLFSVGVLSILIGPKLAIPLDLIVASANCCYLMWLLRKSIMFKETIVLIILTILFVPLGTLFLRQFDKAVIVRGIGAVIVTIALVSLLRMKHLKIFASTGYKWFAGAASGMLGGAFNLPGPPLILYAYNCGWPLRNAMANLQLIFSVMTVMIVLSFSAAGLLNLRIVGMGLAYMPLVIAFTFAGSWMSKRLQVKHLSVVINIVLLCLGTSLLIKG